MASPVRVLVADDDRAIVGTTCDILAASGHVAVGAHSGFEAIARVREERFDCLIMDVNMPGLDGLAALEVVRAIAPDLPVLLMSGGATREQVARAEAAGAWAVLQKPIDVQRLLRFLSLVERDADILVVGEDPALGASLGALLDGTRYHVEAERRPDRVLDRMEEGYKLAVLLEGGGEGARGQEVLASIHARYPTKPVLLVAEAREERADPLRRALLGGAHSCLPRAVERHRLVEVMEDIRRTKLCAVVGESREATPAGNRPKHGT